MDFVAIVCGINSYEMIGELLHQVKMERLMVWDGCGWGFSCPCLFVELARLGDACPGRLRPTPSMVGLLGEAVGVLARCIPRFPGGTEGVKSPIFRGFRGEEQWG